MKYLFLVAILYIVFKSMGKLLSNLKIVDEGEQQVKEGSSAAQKKLRVDESDIEDADFKEVE